MYKIGTDIIRISRVQSSIKSESFLKRVYTDAERQYCSRAESFAGIYAAKEAYFKAMGTGIVLPLTELEVLHDENGKPYFNNKRGCDLSISHDGDYAIAVVVVEV